METGLPLPPPELMHRVGKIDDPDVGAAYEEIGRHSRERIERLLPADWSWAGKRVLDFGCGAGRTLRHFLDETQRAELYGCDIDGPSVAWLADHFSPPLHVFENSELPSLPQPDEFFDLVYALSVFTHLTDHWAGWLLELHRVLKPDGLLFATFLNEGLWPDYGRGRWDEDRIGMNAIKKWNSWEAGGPVVFHSEWWIREHWGRAFEILFLERHDPAEDGRAPERYGQGAALLRRREERPEPEELERAGEDPRELAGARHNVEQLRREGSELFAQLSAVSESHAALAQALERANDEVNRSAKAVEPLRTEVERLRAELQSRDSEIAAITRSRSWRLTAPLRAAAAIVRKSGA